MKKHWFTIVEVGVAVVGLVGWVLSNNIYVAMGAAIVMFGFGVTKPILDARKAARAKRYANQQFEKAESQIDEQLETLLAELPRPIVPLRAVVQVMMERQFFSDAAQQLYIYDAVIDALASGSTLIEIERLINQLQLPTISQQLKGIVALRFSAYADAAAIFHDVARRKPDWADAWFGWLLCEFAQGHNEVVLQNNPQLTGVDLLPFAPADEDCFIALDEVNREQLVTGFQSTLRGIGDLYAAAALRQSREQVSQSREEYRKAA